MNFGVSNFNGFLENFQASLRIIWKGILARLKANLEDTFTHFQAIFPPIIIGILIILRPALIARLAPPSIALAINASVSSSLKKKLNYLHDFPNYKTRL